MERRKKILYLITKSNWGGAQKYVFDLATNLPKGDFDVAVAAGGNGMLFEKLRDAGIRTISIPSLDRDLNFFSDLRIFFSLIKLLRTEKPDVIHINSSKMGGIGALAGRIAGVQKIIFTAHGWPFLEDRSLFQKKLITLASWLTAFFATDVIDITKTTFEQTQKWLLVGDKIKLIHNGINAENFKLVPNTKIRDSFPAGSIIVGTIGELHQNKAQWLLVEAMKGIENKNICLAIVGEGEKRKNLEKEIAGYGIGDRVKLFGFMDAREALLNFDIFALPSKKEGLPYVILEAGLAGLPVIANDVGGIPDIIENGKTGILVPAANNVRELEKAIEDLASDPEEQKRLGAALREKVLREFSLKQMLTETKKLY
jgi:glycosyltransferase involved in cell wall biosynthesis